MTVRRDLDRLDREGLVIRQHGGASLERVAGNPELPYFTDSSKMHKRTFCLFSQLDSIDRLITDAGLRNEDRKLLEDRGIFVVVCGDEES
jgi:DeoR/GlpR family transcriptional regulator of sugar metabolism